MRAEEHPSGPGPANTSVRGDAFHHLKNALAKNRKDWTFRFLRALATQLGPLTGLRKFSSSERVEKQQVAIADKDIRQISSAKKRKREA